MFHNTTTNSSKDFMYEWVAHLSVGQALSALTGRARPAAVSLSRLSVAILMTVSFLIYRTVVMMVVVMVLAVFGTTPVPLFWRQISWLCGGAEVRTKTCWSEARKVQIRFLVNMHEQVTFFQHNHDLCQHQYSDWESAQMRDGCDLGVDAHVCVLLLGWPSPWRSPHPSLTGPGDRVPEMKPSVSLDCYRWWSAERGGTERERERKKKERRKREVSVYWKLMGLAKLRREHFCSV